MDNVVIYMTKDQSALQYLTKHNIRLFTTFTAAFQGDDNRKQKLLRISMLRLLSFARSQKFLGSVLARSQERQKGTLAQLWLLGPVLCLLCHLDKNYHLGAICKGMTASERYVGIQGAGQGAWSAHLSLSHPIFWYMSHQNPLLNNLMAACPLGPILQ